MRLTTQTDYALRVLMHAALASDGSGQDGLDQIDAVAEDFGISRNHVAKVVHVLSARGYLQTVQGRNGGFRLAKRAEEISIGQVIRDLEPAFDLVECFDPSTSRCCIQDSCLLAGELDKALAAFLASLDRVALSDLVQPRRGLRRQLGMVGKAERIRIRGNQ